MNYRIYPPEEPLEADVRLPLSKSIKNRLMILSAMAGSPLPVMDASTDCADTEAMHRALTATLPADINVGGAGTAMRFLTAWFASQPGASVTLDGDERMRQRPIAPLVDALRALGADITYTGSEGFPPLAIRGTRLSGGDIAIDATISSQFISALMMAAPSMSAPLTLLLQGTPCSMSYIRMTAGLLRSFGAEVTLDTDPCTVTLSPARLEQPRDLSAESDWSAASYWFETAALSCGEVTLHGLHAHSLQGDSRIAALMEVTGVRTEYCPDGRVVIHPTPDALDRLQADLTDTPDLLPALAVTCCLLGIPFRFSGLGNLAIKESDRMHTVSDLLLRLGYITDTDTAAATMTWQGMTYPIDPDTIVIPTHGDHRLAMAFAPAALFYPGITIEHTEVVAKSYPLFWQELAKAGFTLTEAETTEP